MFLALLISLALLALIFTRQFQTQHLRAQRLAVKLACLEQAEHNARLLHRVGLHRWAARQAELAKKGVLHVRSRHWETR